MSSTERSHLYTLTLADAVRDHVNESREWVDNYNRTAHIGASPSVYPTRNYHRDVCALPEPVTLDALNELAVKHGRSPIVFARRCDLCCRLKKVLVVIERYGIAVCHGCAKRMVGLLDVALKLDSKRARAERAAKTEAPATPLATSIRSRIVRAGDLPR